MTASDFGGFSPAAPHSLSSATASTLPFWFHIIVPAILTIVCIAAGVTIWALVRKLRRVDRAGRARTGAQGASPLLEADEVELISRMLS